jgi:hypothetical protein
LEITGARQAEQSEELARIIGRGHEAAERAALLTSRLLAFGRRQPLAAETMNPHVPLEAAIDTLRSAIGSDVKVIENLDPSPGLVCGDVQELQNAVFNLCINARDAHAGQRQHRRLYQEPPRPGPVAAELPPADYVEISVPTPASAWPRTWSPVPLSRSIRRSLSARVRAWAEPGAIIESVEGAGTSVRIFLPRADSREPQSVEMTPSGPAALAQPICAGDVSNRHGLARRG